MKNLKLGGKSLSSELSEFNWFLFRSGNLYRHKKKCKYLSESPEETLQGQTDHNETLSRTEQFKILPSNADACIEDIPETW